MPESNYHLYDTLFKKTLTLSKVAVINLINGLFGTDYSTDSEITYHWTEFQNEELRRTLADEYKLLLDFGEQGTFLYRVPVIRFQSLSAEEINDRKLAALLPFRLLQLRERIRKNRSQKNVEALKNLIQNDIIKGINNNLTEGNITKYDAAKLKKYTHELYGRVYSRYEEMEELKRELASKQAGFPRP